jgi:hypothetical protein
VVHNSYRDLIEEKDLLKEEEYFRDINKQRQKANVIAAVRNKQLAAISEQEDLSFDDIHEAKQMYAHEDFQFRMLDAAEKTAEFTEKLLTDTRLKYVRRGQVFGNRFSLAPGTLYQIDVVQPERSASPLPSATLFNFSSARRPVPMVKFFNEGPSPGLFLISTNLDYNNDSQPTVVIPSPASTSAPPNQYILDTGEPVIERINLMATGGTITVNIILEI